MSVRPDAGAVAQPDGPLPESAVRARTTGPRLARPIGVGLLLMWAVLVTVLLGTLMVGHWYTLPTPSDSTRPEVALAVEGLRPVDAPRSWLAVHVLYSQCRCSQRIFAHLFTRERPANLAEHVLLVGEDLGYGTQATARGFGVTRLVPEDLRTRFHIEAAPLLVISAPDGSLRYAGGYTSRKQGPEVADLTILAQLRARAGVAELPAFGCAVSRSLQDLLDPLSMKYARQDQVP